MNSDGKRKTQAEQMKGKMEHIGKSSSQNRQQDAQNTVQIAEHQDESITKADDMDKVMESELPQNETTDEEKEQPTTKDDIQQRKKVEQENKFDDQSEGSAAPKIGSMSKQEKRDTQNIEEDGRIDLNVEQVRKMEIYHHDGLRNIKEKQKWYHNQ
ncbi:putative protein isoform X2 [Capsicum annuum]|uniref:uncharacterized protein LOC107878788 isoform X2 n=1 Tax=Capsicum annuum TaxID=4072 RepID=UPI0007BFBBC4|nr:uncharacterized protein LOC107878788 isoform X2 [Capsicum annuum]XP_016581406.1 uncharacterized protein LOC107878788 isoform X2 [Capsicum annuum]